MDAAPAGGEEAATSRRRSRWGEAEAAGEADPSKKKSRWGNKEETPLMSLGSASLIVQQNPELIKIQVRLTEIQRLQALSRCMHCRIVGALELPFFSALDAHFPLLVSSLSGSCVSHPPP